MKLLFVCLGNTCRSPMAACLMRDYAQREGLSIECFSAGTHAYSNDRASSGAMQEMARRGLSLRDHRTTPLSREDLDRADAIVTMDEGFVKILKLYAPDAVILCFDPPVEDPCGEGSEAYRKAADTIQKQLPELVQRLRELLPESSF